MSEHSPSLPPRGHLFGNAAANVIWSALTALPEEVKPLVLERLQAHLAIPQDRGTEHAVLVAQMIKAVRDAQQINFAITENRVLTEYAYEQLRAEREQRDWPAPATVRHRLGVRTWNEVLSRCHLLRQEQEGSPVRSWNWSFTAEECVTAIKACAEETGRTPSSTTYLSWARREDVRVRPGRRPLTIEPFKRCLGSWTNALISAGLLEETGEDAAHPAIVSPVTGYVMPRGYRYPAEVFASCLQRCAESLGGTAPSIAQYQNWRQQQYALAQESGAPLHGIPTGPSFIQRFGTWLAALAECLSEDAMTRKAAYVSPRRIDDDVLLAAAREAYAAKGDPFTKRAYEDWREEQVEAGRTDVPSASPIGVRFGGWRAVRALIEGEDGSDA